MTLWERRKQKRREIRLRQKAQKAKCLDVIDEVIQENTTWNRRFGDVQRRRAG
jgi:hypothetical protein